MKKVPEFKNEDEEFEFWSKADSTEYVDWSQAERVKLVNLNPRCGPSPCGCRWPWSKT